MPPFVVLELFSSTKAWRAYVDALVVGTPGIRALDADSMGEVTCTCIALVLHSWLIHSLDFVGNVLGLALGDGHLLNETGAPDRVVLWQTRGGINASRD